MMNKTLTTILISAAFWAASCAVADDRDAITVDPDHHHVIFENEHVRVFEAHADAGATSPMHTHPPFVLISRAKARAKLSTPDGNSFIFDLNPGYVAWIDGTEHSWELLSGRIHAFGVEVKAAKSGREPAAMPPGERDAVAVDPVNHVVVLENAHVRVLEALAGPGTKSAMHTHQPFMLISLGHARILLIAPDGDEMIGDLKPGMVLWFDELEHAWEILAGQSNVIAVEVKAAR